MGTSLLVWFSVAITGLSQFNGVLSETIKTCNASKLIEDNKELGLRGSLIPDGNFYASSTSDSSHGPQRGRLEQQASGGQGSSWCSAQVNSNQWLAVDLVYTSRVTAVATQGRRDPISLPPNANYTESWVTKYVIEYSNDNKTYYPLEYKTERPLVFSGNANGESIVCNELPYTITVRYLRFRPKAWDKDTICLRIGVFGTNLNTTDGLSLLPAFEDVGGDPGHDVIWWWIFFWVLLVVLLLVLFLGLLFYWCIVRKRTYSQEKYIKIKPPKTSVQRRQENGSFVNEAYDMTVITKTSGATTPETVGEPEGDEFQEVTAEFTADEQENKKGIVGFSVTDENEDNPDGEEVANGDVNWEKYRKKALQRNEHTYENVEGVLKKET